MRIRTCVEESPYGCGEIVQMGSASRRGVRGPAAPPIAQALAPGRDVRSTVSASGTVGRGCGAAPAARPARPGRSTSSTPSGTACIRWSCGAIRRGVGGESRTASTEYRLLEAAAAAGVAVPRVRVLLAADDDLGRGLRHGPRRGRDDPPPDPPRRRVRRRPAAPRRAVRRDRGAHPRGRPRRAARRCPCMGARRADRAVPRAARHVRRAASRRSSSGCAGSPSTSRRRRPSPTLVHGDFRNGNFIVGPDGIRAVLDWELAHLGDPIEDLGWLCVKSWRFGVADQLVGGFGDARRAARRVRATRAARPVDEDTLRFWVVLGTLKWGVICVGPGVHAPQRPRALGRARRRSAAGSPRRNGTCSICSTEVGDR